MREEGIHYINPIRLMVHLHMRFNALLVNDSYPWSEYVQSSKESQSLLTTLQKIVGAVPYFGVSFWVPLLIL